MTSLQKALENALRNDSDLAMETLSRIVGIDGWFEDDYYEPFDEEFFQTWFGSNPMEAVRAAHFGSIDWNDEYIHLNTYGNLKSINAYEYEKICTDLADEMAEHIIDIKDEYGEDLPDEIQKIIAKFDKKPISRSVKPKALSKKRAAKRTPTKKPAGRPRK